MKATPWTRHPGDDLPGVGSSSRATDHGAVQGIEESARRRLCLRTRARAHDSVRRRCAIAHADAGARLRSHRRAGSRMISARDAEGREGVAVGRESAARSARAHQRSCSTLAETGDAGTVKALLNSGEDPRFDVIGLCEYVQAEPRRRDGRSARKRRRSTLAHGVCGEARIILRCSEAHPQAPSVQAPRWLMLALLLLTALSENGAFALDFTLTESRVGAQTSAKGFGIGIATDGYTTAATSYGHAHVFSGGSGDQWTSWPLRAELEAAEDTTTGFGNCWGKDGNTANCIDVQGDTLVVGAWRDISAHAGGSVYVFSRDVPGDSTSGWSQVSTLVASNAGSEDWFGFNVALDGDTLAIAALHSDQNGPDSGSVYIFTRDTPGDGSSSWTQRHQLVSDDIKSSVRFGTTVALSGDTLVVGCINYHLNWGGAAFVFTRAGPDLNSAWTQRARLLPSDGGSYDLFGMSVAVDGDTIVVGRPSGMGDSISAHGGSAYVFTRESAGDLESGWTLSQMLESPEKSSGDRFGVSVGVEGELIAVGAQREDIFGDDAGAVYLFIHQHQTDGSSSWVWN